MELELPELTNILDQLAELKKMIATKNECQLPEFLNDEQCHALKGGMSLSTYRTNPYYQVKGGIPDAKVGGRKVWRRDTVLEWLPLTDKDLEAYHQKYKTGARKRNG